LWAFYVYTHIVVGRVCLHTNTHTHKHTHTHTHTHTCGRASLPLCSAVSRGARASVLLCVGLWMADTCAHLHVGVADMLVGVAVCLVLRRRKEERSIHRMRGRHRRHSTSPSHLLRAHTGPRPQAVQSSGLIHRQGGGCMEGRVPISRVGGDKEGRAPISVVGRMAMRVGRWEGGEGGAQEEAPWASG
jgi:hypothetical protein